jgi:hypothetical protein
MSIFKMKKFSFKQMPPFWRVIATVLTVCVVILTGITCYNTVTGNSCRRSSTYLREPQYLNNRIVYHPATPYRSGYVLDSRTNEKLIKDLNWLILSSEDSLAVFCQNHLRGYMNINTGKVVIPAQFSKAWLFSEGVAAVMENDSIYFINPAGERIINQGFEKSRDEDDYFFHYGFCKVKLNDKWGVIDTNGTIRVPIEYEYVKPDYKDYWEVMLNEKWGVVDRSGKVIIPCEYFIANVTIQNGIFMSDSNYHCKRYSYTGELLDNFVVNDITELMYEPLEVDEEGNAVFKPADCLRYAVQGDREGLMTKDGRPITEPKFVHIEAIGKDLYLCQYQIENEGEGQGVLMNGKGEILHQ